MIVNVGEAHIVVNILSKEESEELALNGQPDDAKNAKLKLKIFGGPTSGEVL
jgi:hypothetical protein